MMAYAKSSSIRNPVLRYLHRAMTQLMFAQTDGRSVSQTEMDVIWSLLNKKMINFGILFTIYVDRISKKNGITICCGGLITEFTEYIGIPTVEFTPDMGAMFITYEVLFALGLLKTDSSGQAFFLQSERDHFPVPLPQLTKVDTWNNKVNWRLDTAAHRSAIKVTSYKRSLGGGTCRCASLTSKPKLIPPSPPSMNMWKVESTHLLKEVGRLRRRRRNMRKKWKATAAATGELSPRPTRF